MVKDFLVNNIDEYVIYLCDEVIRIVKFGVKGKNKSVIGMSAVSVKIGDYCCWEILYGK